MKLFEPTHLNFSELDPAWCLSEAREIIHKIPLFQKSNGSGKFFSNYWSWHFHKDSQQPLIKKFVASLLEQQDIFQKTFGRPLDLNFIHLSYVEDAAQETCIFHRDGYFWNGQCHLTILGNANIEVQNENETETLIQKNGRLWYLNGTKYLHRIKPTFGERFELLAPVSERPEDVQAKLACVTNTPEQWCDSSHPSWLELRARQVNYVKQSIQAGRASNLSVAEFNLSTSNNSRQE